MDAAAAANAAAADAPVGAAWRLALAAGARHALDAAGHAASLDAASPDVVPALHTTAAWPAGPAVVWLAEWWWCAARLPWPLGTPDA